MKKNLLILTVLLYSFLISAQVPNQGFEDWVSIEKKKPSNWTTYGIITQISTGQEGNYAIRIERDKSGYLGPGAILFGQPSQNSILGGIPFAGRPDSLILQAKYDINPGDTGFIFIFFKKQGIPVSNDTFFITGTDTTGFLRIAYKINYISNEMPDSLILAITSTNPGSNTGYGFVTLDSVYFTNTTLQIPNSGFETWLVNSYEEPDRWMTTNSLFLGSEKLPVLKSTDSYSQEYAILIQNLPFQGYYQRGFALNGRLTNGNILPGFSVSEKYNMFGGYFKFLSENGDQPFILIIMFKSGVEIGAGSLQSSSSVDYSRFNIPIQYFSDVIPDSAAILLMASNYDRAGGNSILMVDSLLLFTGSVPAPAGAITGSKNVCIGENVTYSVPAIEGAETYIWSLPTGASGQSTTNSIVVNFGKDAKSGNIRVKGQNEFGEGLISLYSVTVSGCGSDISEEPLQDQIIFGPNPTHGILKIESDFKLDENYKIEVINILGKSVIVFSNLQKGLPQIDLTNKPDGIYLIKLQTKEKTYLQKIIKE